MSITHRHREQCHCHEGIRGEFIDMCSYENQKDDRKRAAYTPFPWTLDRTFGGAPSIHGADNQLVAVLGYSEKEPTTNVEADARLIAAAPDLLEALEEIVAEFEEEDRQARQEPGCLGLTPSAGVELAYTAIRKARGEE